MENISIVNPSFLHSDSFLKFVRELEELANSIILDLTKDDNSNEDLEGDIEPYLLGLSQGRLSDFSALGNKYRSLSSEKLLAKMLRLNEFLHSTLTEIPASLLLQSPESFRRNIEDSVRRAISGTVSIPGKTNKDCDTILAGQILAWLVQIAATLFADYAVYVREEARIQPSQAPFWKKKGPKTFSLENWRQLATFVGLASEVLSAIFQLISYALSFRKCNFS
ncbi:hypothetical protein Misp06_02940 [Microbulbifer sp. NBRC 101763]|uniref:hypothetical protein n=1 Tax=Microbulbifer sp. NBRC 101763 TaxID=1113820 RepID=UPI0030965CD7